MRFEIAADTDRGIVKETNQDSLLVKCFSTCKGDMAFAVLCDGMGGLSKGELASATVVRAFDRWSDEQLPELCKSSNPDIDSLILERQWDEVIQQQNEKIKAYGKAHAVNMGTTVVALLVTQKAYYIINVGDCRMLSGKVCRASGFALCAAFVACHSWASAHVASWDARASGTMAAMIHAMAARVAGLWPWQSPSMRRA